MKKIFIALCLFIMAFNFNAISQVDKNASIQGAYLRLYERYPNQWERIKENYNGGSWNSDAELHTYIKEYQATLLSQKITVTTTVLSTGKVGVIFNQGGRPLAVNLISQDGAGLVASGGGNLHLAPGDVAKLVASGGGNLVASGGGNLVASGGGNLAGVSFGGNYGTLAAGTKRIPVSGKGAWVIK